MSCCLINDLFLPERTLDSNECAEQDCSDGLSTRAAPSQQKKTKQLAQYGQGICLKNDQACQSAVRTGYYAAVRQDSSWQKEARGGATRTKDLRRRSVRPCAGVICKNTIGRPLLRPTRTARMC